MIRSMPIKPGKYPTPMNKFDAAATLLAKSSQVIAPIIAVVWPSAYLQYSFFLQLWGNLPIITWA